MTWSISDLFPPWGDSGEEPAEGFSWDGGDIVNEKYLDYLYYWAGSMEGGFRSALTDIDSDGDGVVDEAETANAYKGNDIDSDGDGVVNAADTTPLYKGNDIDSDGDGVVDEAETANAYKGNDIDSDGDGVVNAADDAAAYDGLSPSDASVPSIYQTDGTDGQWKGGYWIDGGSGLATLPSGVDGIDVDVTDVQQYLEYTVTDTSPGTSHTVDVSEGGIHQITLDSDVAISFSGVDSDASQGVTIRFQQPGGNSYTVTWPSNVEWASGGPAINTASGDVHLITLQYDSDRDVWYGYRSGMNME
jgi:hypothetical protein